MTTTHDCTRKQKKEDNIEKYYQDKTVKRLPSTLETIYEEPKNGKIMSKSKFKRVVNFDVDTISDRSKIRKRKLKAKKICAANLYSKKKICLDSFVLANLED